MKSLYHLLLRVSARTATLPLASNQSIVVRNSRRVGSSNSCGIVGRRIEQTARGR